jgi:hypothetical protein
VNSDRRRRGLSRRLALPFPVGPEGIGRPGWSARHGFPVMLARYAASWLIFGKARAYHPVPAGVPPPWSKQ